MRRRLVRARWMLSAALALVTGIPLTFAVTQGSGLPPSQVRMTGGGAWLASPAEGVVTLIDGASEQVIALVAAPKVADLSVVQAGTSAYAVSGIQGTVSRLDGASYRESAPVKFGAGGPSGVLAVYPGKSTTYVVDAQRRVASVTDSQLVVRQRLALSAQPAPGQSVVDDRGRLWVVSAAGLAWFDRSGEHVRPNVGGAQSQLVLVRGRAFLVDPVRSRVAALADDGSAGSWSCLAWGPGQSAELFGSDALDRVLAAVSGTGELAFAGVGHNDCGHTVAVGNPGDRFGQPAESGGYVFVPDWTSGRTVIVNVAERSVAGNLPIVKAGNRLELLAKDGLVFYNDLDGDKAGVIHFDGQTWKLGKSLKKFHPGKDGRVVPDAAIPTDLPTPTNAAPPAGQAANTGSQPPTTQSTTTPPLSVIPPTGNPVPPTGNPLLPTGNPLPPTGNPVPPTGNAIPPTGNPLPPTTTPVLPTTPVPPTTPPPPTTTTRPVPTGDPSCGSLPSGFIGNKAKQKIVFPAIPTLTYPDEQSSIPKSVCATSGLPVEFSLSDPDGVCALRQSLLIAAQPESNCTVTATQPGDANFAAAAPVTRSFTVNKQQINMTWAVAPPSQAPKNSSITVKVEVSSPTGAVEDRSILITADGNQCDGPADMGVTLKSGFATFDITMKEVGTCQFAALLDGNQFIEGDSIGATVEVLPSPTPSTPSA